MSRKKCLPLLLLAAACLLVGAREARACSCARTPTVLDQYEWADVVVIVRAVSLEKAAKKADAKPKAKASEKSDEEEEEWRGYRGVISTEMTVEKVYKGNLKAGDAMTFAQGGGADCIWTFDDDDVGKKYLFYLKRLKDETVWLAGTCGRGGGLEYVHDDLLYLNNLDKARGRTRISGTVTFYGENAPGVAGRKIRITGAGKTHEVKTDENGVYEIYDLPAGKYAVEPEMPPGWKVANFWLRYSPSFAGNEEEKSPKKIPIVLEDKKHAGLDLRFDIDNAVRGKIYDPTGRPMNGVCLDLVPADGTKGAYLADCTKNGGAFEIDEIPPGRYVLVVNDDGEVTSSEPFGTFYHPNVLKREDATVFQIGAGDFVEGVNIYAPKTEETITVEGLFLYSDGKPVAGERVEFRTEKTGEDDDSDAQAKTDAKGRFSIKILKGQKGRLHGEMYAYVGKFENCLKLDLLIVQSGKSIAEMKTPAVEIKAEQNLHGVELRYPFPSCKKAKIEQ